MEPNERFKKVGTITAQVMGVFLRIIVLSRELTERNRTIDFKKIETRPAQGLGVVPLERSLFHMYERDQTEKIILKK